MLVKKHAVKYTYAKEEFKESIAKMGLNWRGAGNTELAAKLITVKLLIEAAYFEKKYIMFVLSKGTDPN